MRHSALALMILVVSLPSSGAAQPVPPLPPPQSLRSDRATAVPVDSVLAGLSVEQKAAQLVMPWMSGAPLPDDHPALQRLRRWVDSLGVGGVVVSIGAPRDIAAQLNQLQARAHLPLLVASDLEGGTAIRFHGGTAFPTNMGVGAGGRETDAYAMGRVIAIEGRAVGVHVTFSPVADVNNNPANPIINTRSFGGDPRAVARLVAAQVRGTQEHGLFATAKHFPGHGDTDTDSHLVLPVVRADWARLDTLELVPFRSAIAAGVELIMSAHVAMPGVDSGRIRPATLAPQILTGILRDSLGFQGVIVTDALNMGGVVQSYGPDEAAVHALEAGADILLMPTDPVAAVRAVAGAVHAGRVPMARLDSSVRRVLTLKHRAGLFQRRTVDLDSIAVRIGHPEAVAAAAAASAAALVLLRDSVGVLDRLASRPSRVALVTFAEAGSAGLGSTLWRELERHGHAVTIVRLDSARQDPPYDAARAAVGRAEIAVFAVSVRPREGRGTVDMPAPLAELIATSERPTVLVSFGSPYLIRQVPGVPAYLLAWTSNSLTERAVAAALSGLAPITGRLPVTIPPHYPIGAGVLRSATRGERGGLPE